MSERAGSRRLRGGGRGGRGRERWKKGEQGKRERSEGRVKGRGVGSRMGEGAWGVKGRGRGRE